LTLQEGDSVRAIGKVAQFNGLSQINLDSIVVLATGRTLKSPTPVDSLSEAYESDLVKLTGYYLQNPNQWFVGSGTGFTVKITNGFRTFDLRIDNDNPLFNLPAPTGNILSITGLVGQFDSSIPRNSGYQLFPRKVSDIEIGTSVSELAYKPEVVVFPNPTSGSFQIKSNFGEDKMDIEIFNNQGMKLVGIEGNQDSVNEKLLPFSSRFPKGLYVMKVTEGKSITTQKIIKL
jgi:hypothetical protein